MAHIALYREFRPTNFDEVVEQQHAVAALRQSVITGQIAHAYLFSGTRGTGKTSIAKIFSKAINCLNPQNGSPCNQCEICLAINNASLMDVLEMDAASNNSVENIRRICDEVIFFPTKAKYKVYIIDEVHMLSSGAFNALLKTLEEPPAHAIFLLATTEPHRIPATIISRCQRYDFRRISVQSVIERLKVIAQTKNILINEDALFTIATLSDGALRDAISLFDQVSTNATTLITREDILQLTGIVDDNFIFSFCEAIFHADYQSTIGFIQDLVMDGRDIIRFALDLAHYFRDLLVIKISPNPETLIQLPLESIQKMSHLAQSISTSTLTFSINYISNLIGELKWSPDLRTSFEIALLGLQTQIAAPPSITHNAASPSLTPLPESSLPKVQAKPVPPSPSSIKIDSPPSAPLSPSSSTQASTLAQTSTSPEPSSSLSNPNLIWQNLLQAWDESIFVTALILKNASFKISQDQGLIILPNHMSTCIDTILSGNDYQVVQKDLMQHFLHIASIRLITEDQSVLISNNISAPNQIQEDIPLPNQPQWVENLKTNADKLNIEIEIN